MIVATGAGYDICIMNSAGTVLKWIPDFMALQYVRTVNDVGYISLTLDNETAVGVVGLDYRIAVWRRIPGVATFAYIDTKTIFFMRRWTKTQSVTIIEGFSATYLLGNQIGNTGRILAYDADSAFATYSGAADDVLKQIVRDNYTAIDASRDIGTGTSGVDLSAYLTVASNRAEAPSIDKAASRRNVLRTLQEICDTSAQLGTPLYFDIETDPGQGSLKFVTTITCRSTDRSTGTGDGSVVFDPDDGGVTDLSITFDYENAASAAVAAGLGKETDRLVGTSTDSSRINMSAFAYREVFRNAAFMDADSQDIVDDEAAAMLYEFRPRVSLTGSIIGNESLVYGRDWKFGDKVSVNAFGAIYDAHIATVAVSVENNEEGIQVRIRVDS